MEIETSAGSIEFRLFPFSLLRMPVTIHVETSVCTDFFLRSENMDTDFEDLIPLQAVCRLIPGGVHISSIHRWRLRGVRGVRLQTVLLGGRRFVSKAALEDFFAQVSAAADGRPVPARTPRQREREIAKAIDELKREGS